ncbi:MAG: mRNA surveillance protein pelota [Promethearchaeota archaeon]
MQILHTEPNKGLVKVQIANLEDLWVLYNIIQDGDTVGARTFRRVVIREGDAGERKPMYLELKVESLEFHEYSNRLRIKGQITKGPDEFISLGQYHTINVTIGTKLTIIKDKWYQHEIKRLNEATKSGENKIILVVALETGLATISLVSNYSIRVVSTLRKNIPGKRYSKQHFMDAITKFFEELSGIIAENIKNNDINLVIICGPGFLKEQYQETLRQYLKQQHMSVSVRVASASSGTESAIYEVLRKGDIASIIADHRLSEETNLMEEFITHLGKDDGLITYGLEETLKAAEMGAIEILMVTDIVMREIRKNKEQDIEKLFNLVESARGQIKIFSTLHPAGEQLQNYTGIAAILRYKI